MVEKEPRDDIKEAKRKVQKFTHSPVRRIFPKNKPAKENQLATIHAKQHCLF
jgi:hypothetical protein